MNEIIKVLTVNEFKRKKEKSTCQESFEKLYCQQKNSEKADRFCKKFFLTPSTSVQQVAENPTSNSMLPYSAMTLFQRISQSPGQDQQNGNKT